MNTEINRVSGAWLSGFFETAGTVSFNIQYKKSGKEYSYPQLQVSDNNYAKLNN